MARSINTIQNIIMTAIANDPVLSQLNSTSQVAIYRLFAYIIATTQNQQDILNDALITQVESLASLLPVATAQWIQEQAFLFQYSATTPQIIQFATQSFAPYYPIVNPAYQIISNCTVTSTTPAQVKILVAKGSTSSTPQPLSSSELSTFQYYMNEIMPTGISPVCNSLQADRLWSQFTVIYDPAYAGTIQNSLLIAYNNYLENINFGGTIKLVDITLALRNVTGVIDLQCTNMQARPASTPFGLGFQLVNNSTVINRVYTTYSGYIIDETSTNDFISQLTLKTTDN